MAPAGRCGAAARTTARRPCDGTATITCRAPPSASASDAVGRTRGRKRDVRQIRRVGAAGRHLGHQRRVAAPERHVAAGRPEVNRDRRAPAARAEHGGAMGIRHWHRMILMDSYRGRGPLRSLFISATCATRQRAGVRRHVESEQPVDRALARWPRGRRPTTGAVRDRAPAPASGAASAVGARRPPRRARAGRPAPRAAGPGSRARRRRRSTAFAARPRGGNAPSSPSVTSNGATGSVSPSASVSAGSRVASNAPRKCSVRWRFSGAVQRSGGRRIAGRLLRAPDGRRRRLPRAHRRAQPRETAARRTMSSAAATDCVRTICRSPAKRSVFTISRGPLSAMTTVPTGFSGDPPSGPAMPVIARPTSAPSRSRTRTPSPARPAR